MTLLQTLCRWLRRGSEPREPGYCELDVARQCEDLTIYPCVEIDILWIPPCLMQEVEQTLHEIGWPDGRWSDATPMLVTFPELPEPLVVDWLNLVAEEIVQSDSPRYNIWACAAVSCEGHYCFGYDMCLGDMEQFALHLRSADANSWQDARVLCDAADWLGIRRRNDQVIIKCVHHGAVEGAYAFDFRDFDAKFQSAIRQIKEFRTKVDAILRSDPRLADMLKRVGEGEFPVWA